MKSDNKIIINDISYDYDSAVECLDMLFCGCDELEAGLSTICFSNVEFAIVKEVEVKSITIYTYNTDDDNYDSYIKLLPGRKYYIEQVGAGVLKIDDKPIVGKNKHIEQYYISYRKIIEGWYFTDQVEGIQDIDDLLHCESEIHTSDTSFDEWLIDQGLEEHFKKWLEDRDFDYYFE